VAGWAEEAMVVVAEAVEAKAAAMAVVGLEMEAKAAAMAVAGWAKEAMVVAKLRGTGLLPGCSCIVHSTWSRCCCR
jgi:hypothetical protein